MADRRARTLLLIASRHDLLWLPQSRPTASGFVPAQVEACASCSGTGRVKDRFGRLSRCARCQGRGRVAFDPMDPLRLPVGSASTGSSAPRPRATVRCDSCGGDGAHGNGRRCEVCGGEGRRELHAFELQLDLREPGGEPVDDALERRWRAGSYVELDRALQLLRSRSWRQHGALLEAVDLGLVPLPGRLELPLRFVVERMPNPVRVPADVVANAKELAEWRRRARGRGTSAAAIKARDGEIRRAVRRGVPTQRVAFEFGLSPSQVRRIAFGEVTAS